MSRVIVTYVYAHNNQEDALRFRDQVHEILRDNKRYISNEILLVSQQKPVIKDSVLPSEEDGNLLLQINGNLYYHCVKIVFIYKIKNQHQHQQPIISLFYKCGDRFHADNPSKSYISQMCKTDLIALHKIAKLYREEFEFGQLDENIIIGPQVGVFPSRRFSTSDVMNTVVDQENLNTKGSSMTPRHPHSEPAMISWVDKLDSLMSKDDPDYDRFQKFKELWKEIIATGIATKNLRLNSDMPYGPQTTGRLIFSPPNSKDKEEDIVDNTVEQINESKHRLRTLPDPRYLPNANYTRKLIDELDDLLNGSNVIKAKDNTYILNADTFYNAVAKLSAIRNAVSKPGMWVDSQTSCWIHTNKDYETLKVLKTYLECEAKKYVNYPACIIETDMMNHMINLIEDALNLYAVDPK